MEKIKLSEEIVYQLIDLIDTLYLKGYFGFKENALDYVEDIENFIFTIPTQKQSLSKYKRIGSYYSKYKRNNKTTWYVFFDRHEDLYLIKFITNNHTKIYSKLI